MADENSGQYSTFCASSSRCTAHESIIRAIAITESVEKALMSAIEDLKRSDREITQTLKEMQQTFENYVDRRLEKRDESNKSAMSDLERRITLKIEGVPDRLLALEHFQSIEDGERRIVNSQRDRMPKWASVVVAILAIVVAVATSVGVSIIASR